MTFGVSVCIPAYRQPDVLLRTVESVLMQKGCEFEVVITDDSDDDSVESALGQLTADSRVRYFRNATRLGAIGNWNASVEKARTDIIKILHHDDWFISDVGLLQSSELIASGETLVVFSACRAMSVDGSELFTHCAKPEQIEPLRKDPASLVFANVIGPPSVATFSRKALVDFNPRYTWLSDVDFYIRLIKKAKGDFRYLDEPLINVTSDSAAQLSRECERQRLRSVKENISLFAECGTDHLPYNKLVSHFFLLAQGLRFSEIGEAMYFSGRLGEVRIVSALFKGLLFSMVSGK